MTTVTIEEAQASLPDLIASLQPGEELVITDRNLPVARLVGEARSSPEPRRPGSAVGKLVILAEDDEHLEDFKDYMP